MYFFGLILSGIVFMLITHFLSYTFGKVGNAISIGFVALQFVLTTPLFPKEMLPSLYSGLIPFTPVFYGDTAVRQAVLGGLTNEIYNSAILILVVLGIIFLTLTNIDRATSYVSPSWVHLLKQKIYNAYLRSTDDFRQSIYK